jgi:hypothetical protein
MQPAEEVFPNKEIIRALEASPQNVRSCFKIHASRFSNSRIILI